MPSLETEAPRTFRSRSLLAFGVAAVWGLSAVPFFAGFSSCPTARLLHTPCPGCGMSRALAMVAHGDVGASLVMHPLAVPTLLVQGAFAAATILVTFQRGSPFELLKVRYGRASVYALVGVFGLVFLLWIARMMGFAGGPVLV